MNTAIFEWDLVYPTNNLFNPGSVRISVMNPDMEGRLSLLISPGTEHNPLDYVDKIIETIQSGIFNRIHIDIRNHGIFFFKADNSKYIKLVYEDGEPRIVS